MSNSDDDIAPLVQLTDLESLVIGILSLQEEHDTKDDPEYTVTEKTSMLAWKQPVEAEQVAPNLWRIGAIGDGNCMVHSMLFAASPSYRQEPNKYRAIIADTFRKILNKRVGELKGIADTLYAEIGGWNALEESFDILENHPRSELNLEIGPVIARLYGLNFLGLHIHEGRLKPLLLTYTDGRYDPSLPTVLINYIAGRVTNLGISQASVKAVPGHYEVFVSGTLAPVPVPSPVKTSKSKSKTKKTPPTIFSAGTTYEFQPGNPALAQLIREFERTVKDLQKETAALRILERARHVINDARAATFAAGKNASSPPKMSGSPRYAMSPRSVTRKRSFASASSSPRKASSHSRKASPKKASPHSRKASPPTPKPVLRTLSSGSGSATKKPTIRINSI